MIRDSQRARHYAAETDVERTVGKVHLPTWQDVDLYAREVQERDWWRESGFPRVSVYPGARPARLVPYGLGRQRRHDEPPRDAAHGRVA